MKFVILGVIALILVGGGVYVVASMGILKIPGISPTDFGKPIVASKDQSQGWVANLGRPLDSLQRQAAAAEAAKKPAKPADATPTAAKPDPDKGNQKLAELWNGMDADKLKDLTSKWADTDIAKVLVKMEPDQVSEYLAALDPARADKISKAIQNIASQPEPAAPATTPS